MVNSVSNIYLNKVEKAKKAVSESNVASLYTNIDNSKA